jgi:hypothetical protein
LSPPRPPPGQPKKYAFLILLRKIQILLKSFFDLLKIPTIVIIIELVSSSSIFVGDLTFPKCDSLDKRPILVPKGN